GRTRRSREARPTALVGDRPLLSLLPAVRLARLVAPVAAAAHLAAHLLHRPAELLELPLQFADLVARDARLARPLDVPRGGFGATTGPRLRVLAPTRLGLASRRRGPPAARHAREARGARGARGAEPPPTGAAFDPRQLLLRLLEPFHRLPGRPARLFDRFAGLFNFFIGARVAIPIPIAILVPIFTVPVAVAVADRRVSVLFLPGPPPAPRPAQARRPPDRRPAHPRPPPPPP